MLRGRQEGGWFQSSIFQDLCWEDEASGSGPAEPWAGSAAAPLAASSRSELSTCSDDGSRWAPAAAFPELTRGPALTVELATSFHNKTVMGVNCVHRFAIEQVHKMFIRCSLNDGTGGQPPGFGRQLTSGRGCGGVPRQGDVSEIADVVLPEGILWGRSKLVGHAGP